MIENLIQGVEIRLSFVIKISIRNFWNFSLIFLSEKIKIKIKMQKLFKNDKKVEKNN